MGLLKRKRSWGVPGMPMPSSSDPSPKTPPPSMGAITVRLVDAHDDEAVIEIQGEAFHLTPGERVIVNLVQGRGW